MAYGLPTNPASTDRYLPTRSPSGGPTLDSAPPTPPDVTKPGDSTRSLLGDDMSANPGGGIGASTPGGRANSGVMMLMQGVNEIQSVFPGHPLLPQLIQIVSQLSSDIPQAIAAMRTTVAPNQLLAAIGQSGAPQQMGQMGPAAAIPPTAMPNSQQMPM